MSRISARITVYVQPRAARTELAGLHDGQPKIRLAAPPVDGAANAELVAFIAQQLNIPKRRVRVVSGLSSRHKTVEIGGVSADSVTRALAQRPFGTRSDSIRRTGNSRSSHLL